MSEARPAVPAPVEAKVKASASGAGLGAALGAAAVWAVDQYVWTPGVDGDLPPVLAGLILAAVAAAVAWVAGWEARHTHRPDLAPPEPAP